MILRQAFNRSQASLCTDPSRTDVIPSQESVLQYGINCYRAISARSLHAKLRNSNVVL
jgi:hypothetical protein